jgi:pyruvate/2-oxoglutarate dehydrogenase complex dihydrolipoamide dehydrogenase (E3) component
MERMRRLRADISVHDSAQRFSTALSIDVFIGRGAFTSANTICVNGTTLTFRKAVIATGGSAALPQIEGLKSAPYLTNSSIFNLTQLPKRMVVIGAGAIGMELAQGTCICHILHTTTYINHQLPLYTAVDAACMQGASVQYY